MPSLQLVTRYIFHTNKHSTTEGLNINVNALIKQILAAIYNNIRRNQKKIQATQHKTNLQDYQIMKPKQFFRLLHQETTIQSTNIFKTTSKPF